MEASKNMATPALSDTCCSFCGDQFNGEIFDTVYGDRYCDSCYDEYLFSNAGKLEYLASLVRGEMSVDMLDAETLCDIAVAWENYHHLLQVSLDEFVALEAKMKELNLI